MKLKYYILISALTALLCPLSATAQANGTNSSYSRFGLGLPCNQSQSYNRSMAGVAQGLRDGSRVNMQNPASYSSMDSLTFLFDVGMGLQRTRLNQNGAHKGINNTSFDHVNIAFRAARHLGMSIGFLPYSKIGYNFSQTEFVGMDPYTGQSITNTYTYTGSGGLHQAYIGAGWQPFKGFSIGANASFLWGNLNHQVTQYFEENGTTNTSSFNSLLKAYVTHIATWKADAALQYQFAIGQEDKVTIGATAGIGHKLNGESQRLSTQANSTADTLTTKNGFSLPMTYSGGVAWEHAQKLTIAADFTYEQWSKCYTPQYDEATATYTPQTGTYTDSWRVNVGAEYIPERYTSQYLQRINYRLGAYYSSPNLLIPQNGQKLNGPAEFGLTAGVGLPITNKYNNRSYVNVGVGWSYRKASAASLIKENILSINIGMTFNERWFMKWKFK